ncbi:MAG: Subtilisin-like serine protease [Chlorobi bacterium]|nr:Subtilisin-like serine protease [Chlorobiota bacterium]
MKSSLRAFVLTLALLTASLAHAADGDAARTPSSKTATPVAKGPAPTYLTGVVIIKLKSTTANRRGNVLFGVPELDQVLREISVVQRTPLLPMAPFDQAEALGPQREKDHGFDRIYKVRFSGPYDAAWVAAEIRKTGLADYAEPYYTFQLSYTPNDPLLAQQYWLDAIHAKEAWDITRGDSTISIAIIDSGVDWAHEDLNGNIAVNSGETGLDAQGKDKRTNGVDDDKNGFVDDWHGWDLVGNPKIDDLQQAQFFPDNDAAPKPNTSSGYEGYHGTAVSGCASGRADNAKGIAGIGFRTKILPVKCAADSVITNQILAGYDGIAYAADRGARVINCSFGGPGDGSSVQAIQDIVDYAYGKGALVVAASGNMGTNNDVTPGYPANLNHVLSVGATDSQDSVAGFSEYGISVNVWAPGVNTLTTMPGNQYNGGGVSGTSFSSPIVAGVAALVLSVHPTWTPDQVMMQLRVTGDRVKVRTPDLAPLYYRRVNALRAVGFNKDFNAGSASTFPGIAVVSYSVEGKTQDTIRSADAPVTVQLTLKNYLAPAGNIRITALPGGPLTLDSDAVIPTIGTLETIAQNIRVKLNPAAATIYSEGDLQLLLKFSGGIYEDIIPVKIPVYLPGWHRPSDPVASATNFVGSGIVAPLHDVAFAIANVTSGNTSIPKITRTLDGQVWSQLQQITSSNDPAYCITAIDGKHVWVGTGPTSKSANIYRSTNAGYAWQKTSVATITPFVNAIHFFDDMNGIFVGDALNSVWGIGVTTDAGVTWKSLPSPLALGNATESGWNNSFAAVGDTIWFGTNNSRIYRSTNRGQSWAFASTPSIHSFGVAFANGQDGLATFNQNQSGTGSDMVAMSRNGGQTWTATKLPFTGAVPQGVAFIPHSSRAIVGTQNGIYTTSDFGATWKPMPMPIVTNQGFAFTTVMDPLGNIAAYATNALNEIILYTEASKGPPPLSAPDLTSAPAAGAGATLYQNIPNPFNASTTIPFELRSAADIELSLYDALGAQVRVLAQERMSAGAHSVTLDGADLAQGVYYYSLSVNGEKISRRMLLVR